DRGEEIDEKRDRLPEPARRELGQEDRDADGEWRRDDERKNGRDESAEHGRRGAEPPGDVVPFARRIEAQAEVAKRRPRTAQHFPGDEEEQGWDDEREGRRRALVDAVADGGAIHGPAIG